ncbi:unnamed protein product [Paramecium octaurelia]|uniref:Uncharacterized protein n=1 Tax=Paramecium octaurelia TaxID=43137 RepID=A0A8S1UNM7_PAROT|nr:unnamed protein product [Paramecium octaurelia]
MKVDSWLLEALFQDFQLNQAIQLNQGQIYKPEFQQIIQKIILVKYHQPLYYFVSHQRKNKKEIYQVRHLFQKNQNKELLQQIKSLLEKLEKEENLIWQISQQKHQMRQQ